MKNVPRELLRASVALGVLSDMGAKMRNAKRPAPLDGHNSISPDDAIVHEWTLGAEVVARKVEACGTVACWLRADIAEKAAAAIEAEHADIERVKSEVAATIERDRQRRTERPSVPFVPSHGMLRSLFRYQSRTGRLHDRNSRGDETRARMALLIDRAGMSHDGEDI